MNTAEQAIENSLRNEADYLIEDLSWKSALVNGLVIASTSAVAGVAAAYLSRNPSAGVDTAIGTIVGSTMLDLWRAIQKGNRYEVVSKYQTPK